MTNPYEIRDADEIRAADTGGADGYPQAGYPQAGYPPAGHAEVADGSARERAHRPLLWFVLVVSAAANSISSTSHLNMLFGVGFGMITLACAIALVVDHYRRRAR